MARILTSLLPMIEKGFLEMFNKLLKPCHTENKQQFFCLFLFMPKLIVFPCLCYMYFFLFDVKWIYCVVDAIVLAECCDNGSFLAESNQNRVMSFSFFLVCMDY